MMSKQLKIFAVLAAAVFGLTTSGSALALPEVFVGSRLLGGTSEEAQTQAVEPDNTVVADEDSIAADDAKSTSN